MSRNVIFVCLCVVNLSSAFILDTFLGSAVQPVSALDVQKYLGRWFQMYGSQSIYATFERGAYCVTADYTLANDGTNHITVLNSERLNSGTGPIKVIHGYATPSDTPGKLTVHLETVIFDAPYWVIKLGPATYGSENKYQYAIVSDNVKATLFVLARDPEVFKRDYEAEVLQFLKEKGFTTIIGKSALGSIGYRYTNSTYDFFEIPTLGSWRRNILDYDFKSYEQLGGCSHDLKSEYFHKQISLENGASGYITLKLSILFMNFFLSAVMIL